MLGAFACAGRVGATLTGREGSGWDWDALSTEGSSEQGSEA